jgi:hypothetical protein
MPNSLSWPLYGIGFDVQTVRPPTNGLQLCQQLETAREQPATHLIRRGIDEQKRSYSPYSHRTSEHRSARVPSDQRLWGGYATVTTLQTPSGTLSVATRDAYRCSGQHFRRAGSRNITNSGLRIGRTDGLRAFPMRAVPCSEGTMHRCLPGSIPRFTPREATVRRHPAAAPHSCVSITCIGLPPLKRS